METKTLCHRNDPETSRQAAEKMVVSGELNRQEQEVFALIKWKKNNSFLVFPTFTAKELSNYRLYTEKAGNFPNVGFLNYYTIQRRLSGLHRKGKIERTGAKRDGCCVWRLI